MNKLFIICLTGLVVLSAGAQAETIKNAGQAKPDLTKENVLYVVGYARRSDSSNTGSKIGR